jgi:xylan 1,4-beta-xylosidase
MTSFWFIVAAGLLALWSLEPCIAAQVLDTSVVIHVDANKTDGTYRPIWNYFGADEPNYTYAPNGTRLLRELSAINPAVPVYFRPHNLLTSGNGQGSLKWGSTNVYTEKPNGTPVYDWTITDRLFDNLKATHVRPMVEIGFMPEALSPHPTPYRHQFPNGEIFTGWSYPPKDYAKWRALLVAWVEHLHDRYGADVDTWPWEVWNEPDIPYFHGSVKDYEKLYDVSTAAVRQVLPNAIVGGPAVTGPVGSTAFLEDFLEHCAHGVNGDSGKVGAPLDFISFHPKGAPKFENGHVRMNLARQLRATDLGMQVVARYPEFRQTPIILSETDPEGCAACQGPQNGYRNGPLYGVSVAEMLARSAQLARLRGVNLRGAVTWAFEFEDQPWFAGFRELATNGVDKPVLNVFRMYGMLGGVLLPLTSSSGFTAEQIEANGVVNTPDISGLATRAGNAVNILVWNYHDADVAAAPAPLALEVAGLDAKKIHVTEYRMDAEHSNAYALWLQMGSPQHPSEQQVATMRKSGGLQVLDEKTVAKNKDAPLRITASLPRQGVALYHLTW